MAGKHTKQKKSRRKSGGSSSSAEVKRKPMKTSTKVVIIIFAVLMAVSMTVPSFASFFAGKNAGSDQEAQEEQATVTTTADSGSSAPDTTALTQDVPESLQTLASTYAPEVADLQQQLQEDPNNMAALINLAHQYSSWGYQAASQVVSASSGTDAGSSAAEPTEEESDYVNGLLDQSLDYYDQYLKLNDSNTAKTERAMVLYVKGDKDGATSALEQVTTDAPDFGPAWYRLGVLAEGDGDTEKAKEDYQKAADGDPNDEYGVKTAATQRLLQLTAPSSDISNPADAISSADSGSSAKSLASDLASDSGLGF